MFGSRGYEKSNCIASSLGKEMLLLIWYICIFCIKIDDNNFAMIAVYHLYGDIPFVQLHER
jgi:hypothetical protein